MRSITYADCVCGHPDFFYADDSHVCAADELGVDTIDFSDEFFYMAPSTTTTLKYQAGVSSIQGAAVAVGGVVGIMGSVIALVVGFLVLKFATNAVKSLTKGTEKALGDSV
jgi:hypothetical protein